MPASHNRWQAQEGWQYWHAREHRQYRPQRNDQVAGIGSTARGALAVGPSLSGSLPMVGTSAVANLAGARSGYTVSAVLADQNLTVEAPFRPRPTVPSMHPSETLGQLRHPGQVRPRHPHPAGGGVYRDDAAAAVVVACPP